MNGQMQLSHFQAWAGKEWRFVSRILAAMHAATDVRLYDCYASPLNEGGKATTPPILDRFVLDSAERLRALDAACGRLATETGAFWSSPIGSKISRRHRVDRELLAEISALEQRLVDLKRAIYRHGARGAERTMYHQSRHREGGNSDPVGEQCRLGRAGPTDRVALLAPRARRMTPHCGARA